MLANAYVHAPRPRPWRALLLAIAVQVLCIWLLQQAQFRRSVVNHPPVLLAMLVSSRPLSTSATLPRRLDASRLTARRDIRPAQLEPSSTESRPPARGPGALPAELPPLPSVMMPVPATSATESIASTQAQPAAAAARERREPALDLLNGATTQRAIRDAASALERESRHPSGPASTPAAVPGVAQIMAKQFARTPDYTEFRASDGTTFIKMPGGSCMVVPSAAGARDAASAMVRYTTPEADGRCPR